MAERERSGGFQSYNIHSGSLTQKPKVIEFLHFFSSNATGGKGSPDSIQIIFSFLKLYFALIESNIVEGGKITDFSNIQVWLECGW